MPGVGSWNLCSTPYSLMKYFSFNPPDQQKIKKVRCKKTKQKNVWIVGDYLVTLMSKLKLTRKHGIKEHRDWKPIWKGLLDMSLAKLVRVLQKVKGYWPKPTMLIIHLGYCDLPHRNLEQNLLSIQQHLVIIRKILPPCLIVWSDILPSRLRKVQGHKPSNVVDVSNNHHDEVNRRVHIMVKGLGGTAITHENLRPEHFDQDNQLSDTGKQLLHRNILEFLYQWKWDTNSTPGPAEALPEPPGPAVHREQLKQLTHGTGQPVTGKTCRLYAVCTPTDMQCSPAKAHQANVS